MLVWALEQWPENTQVNLAEELPSLKALIHVQRERAIAAGIDPDVIDFLRVLPFVPPIFPQRLPKCSLSQSRHI